MPAAISKLAEGPEFLDADSPAPVRVQPPTVAAAVEPAFFSRILTTSVAAHLLLIGLLGAGLPKNTVRAKRPVPPPTPASLVEDIKLQEELPPEPPKPAEVRPETPAPEVPAAAQIDLPPVSQVEPIAAVPASVPVAFGLEVKGRVRLVSDASRASGSVGGRALKEPVAIDGDSSQEKNLLLPPIGYPPEALLRHHQGTVLLEFRTSPTGEIYDVTVRTGSGSPALDRAAVKNLTDGRWRGAAGYYLKTYEFKLN